MFIQLLSMMLAQASPIILADIKRIPMPMPTLQGSENVDVRISAPEGLLWQGTLRVAPNQGASYQQSLAQAAPGVCPPVTSDRSERRQLNFNLYLQSYQGPPSLRIDVSWVRPIPETGCGETGTRTVQINQTLLLDQGQSTVITGDAGLRVEITRR